MTGGDAQYGSAMREQSFLKLKQMLDSPKASSREAVLPDSFLRGHQQTEIQLLTRERRRRRRGQAFAAQLGRLGVTGAFPRPSRYMGIRDAAA